MGTLAQDLMVATATALEKEKRGERYPAPALDKVREWCSRQGGQFTSLQASRETGIFRSNVNKYFRRLEAEGCLELVRNGGPGAPLAYWRWRK